MCHITVSSIAMRHSPLPDGFIDGFDEQPASLPQTPAARAAGLARGALIFREKLQSGQVKPDATKEGDFCMDTYRYVEAFPKMSFGREPLYRWMFDCCRIPGLQGLDWSVSHAGTNVDEVGHIIVVRRNRFWMIKGIVDGRILSMTELEKWVIRHCYVHLRSYLLQTDTIHL